MKKIKAAYLPHDHGLPHARYVLDPALAASGAEAQKVKDACPYEAIELDMQPKAMESECRGGGLGHGLEALRRR